LKRDLQVHRRVSVGIHLSRRATRVCHTEANRCVNVGESGVGLFMLSTGVKTNALILFKAFPIVPFSEGRAW
jgi:hypothetical protein